MRKFDDAAVGRVNALASRAMDGIRRAIDATGIDACVTGDGSMFRVHMKKHAPRNFREAYMTPEERGKIALLLDHLFESGFVMINTCTATMSTAMGESEIDALVDALGSGFEKLADRS